MRFIRRRHFFQRRADGKHSKPKSSDLDGIHEGTMSKQVLPMSDFPETFSAERQSALSHETESSVYLSLAARHRTPAIPSQDLMDLVGGGDFQHIGLINVYNIIAFCGLRPHHWILEPGCGSGRNARLIAPLLDSVSGNYSGFDVSRPAIAWCRESISSLYPNVRFDHADIQNSHYNPEGSIKPEEYRFPYEDEKFDVVFLPSVFTHMRRDGFEHYLDEIHRVIKPGGRLLSWHFLLENSAKPGKFSAEFVPYDDISLIHNKENPDSTVVYDCQYVLKTLERKGFALHARMRGDWDGFRPTGFADYQDRILSSRLGTAKDKDEVR